MEEKLKKLRLLASTNPKRFLEELRDLISEWKSLTKTEKKKFENDIRTLEKVANDLFLKLYTKRANSNDNVISAIEKGTANIFDKGNLKLNTLKLREMLSLIQDDKTDKALKVMDGISSNVKSRGETILNTLLIGNNRASVIENAKKRGINQFRYEGPRGELSRDFCKSRVGKVYTIEEIELMDNQQRLPVLYFCGGYNCRHRWVVVIPGEITNDKGAKPKAHELETAEKLSKQGINVHFVKESDKEGVKMYDAVTNSRYNTEFKIAKNYINQSGHIRGRMDESEKKQSEVLVIDVIKESYDLKLAKKDAEKYIREHASRFKVLKQIWYLKNGKIVKQKIGDSNESI